LTLQAGMQHAPECQMRVNLRLARVRSDSFKFTRHHSSGMLTAGSGSGPQEHGLIEQDPWTNCRRQPGWVRRL